MTSLPRSVVLSLWASPVLAGCVAPEALLQAVQGDDEPHQASTTGAAALPPADGLADLVAALRDAGVGGLHVELPVPGHPGALPGPRAVNVAALDAGECLLTVGGPPIALVPEVVRFGSVHEPGHLVTWLAMDCEPPPAPGAHDVGDAERELREALVLATNALQDLDVGTWRTDVDHRLGQLREVPLPQLPPGLPARSARVMDLAWRVARIVQLAREDDGGSITSWQAGHRQEQLRTLDDVSRRAVVAAVNAAHGGPR